MHKFLFAAGGTGGHLFPAQALAKQLQADDPNVEVLFGGGHLASNPFFDHMQFPFREIASASPLRKNPFKALALLFKGYRESLSLCRECSFDLVVGFGSFYSFPLLLAAKTLKIPYILIESNAYPGHVNRLFSSKAQFTALQFSEAVKNVKGASYVVQMPSLAKAAEKEAMDKAEASRYFGFDPDRFTLLVFGGSQGAGAINRAMANVDGDLQIIHLCGKQSDMDAIQQEYEKKGIRSYVKPFESQIQIAWAAADLAIVRSGAGTLAEVIDHTVPAILIPWPGATQQHQQKNAEVLQSIGGAILLKETHLSNLQQTIGEAKKNLPQMRARLETYKQRPKISLCKAIYDHFGGAN